MHIVCRDPENTAIAPARSVTGRGVYTHLTCRLTDAALWQISALPE